MDKLIKNALVVTMDTSGRVFRGDIRVSDGRIRELGPDLRPSREIEIIDAGNFLILPGFVNAHLHSYMVILKGMAEGLDLHAWKYNTSIVHLIDRTKRRIGRDLLHRAHLLSYCEQIRGGVSFVGEFNFPRLALGAMKEVGIKGVLTCDFDEIEEVRAEVGGEEGHPVTLYIPEEEELGEKALSRIGEKYSGSPTLKVMHAAETILRADIIRQRFGCDIVRLLEKYYLLDRYMIFSHGVHVEPDGIRAMKEAGARVISSVTSEMKLSDGIAPVLSFIREGIMLGIGTDSAMCNNSGDIFSEMKVMGLLQNLVSGPGAVNAEEIVRMATIDGARVFGMEEEIGSIEVGKRADLVFLDTRTPEMVPLVDHGVRSNVYANIVYSAGREQVKDLLVDGEYVLKDRHPVRVDMDRLLAEIEEGWGVD